MGAWANQQSWIKVVETLSEKDPFRSTSEFSMANFHFSTPSPLFNVVTRWKCPRSVLQHWKGGEGALAINKKDAFWNYGRTPIESVCFAQMCQHFCPWLKPPYRVFNMYADMYKKTEAPKPDTKTPKNQRMEKNTGNVYPRPRQWCNSLGFRVC